MGWFALASYRRGPELRSAIVLEHSLFDLQAVISEVGFEGRLNGAASISELLRDWDRCEPILAALADTGFRQPPVAAKPVLPFEPFRVFAAASNYIEHAEEMKTKLAAKADSTPYVFLKSQTSAIGTREPVVIPRESHRVDWEVELGVVIGRGGRRISVERAQEHIAGYVVVNDVSARDLTRRSDVPFSHDWFRGKSFDSFMPMGPWLVPRAFIRDPHELRLSLTVNGETMQDGRTDAMIFNVFEQIAFISTLTELRPGDVIATGTPAGVGMARGVFLKPGDTMVAEIAGIGAVTSPLVAEG